MSTGQSDRTRRALTFAESPDGRRPCTARPRNRCHQPGPGPGQSTTPGGGFGAAPVRRRSECRKSGDRNISPTMTHGSDRPTRYVDGFALVPGITFSWSQERGAGSTNRSPCWPCPAEALARATALSWTRCRLWCSGARARAAGRPTPGLSDLDELTEGMPGAALHGTHGPECRFMSVGCGHGRRSWGRTVLSGRRLQCSGPLH